MSQVKKFIFVSGPSESGKSSGVNYISGNFPDVVHLKIKNIYRALYEKSESSMEYNDWRHKEITNSLIQHWKDYLNLASTMSEGKDVIIMDTLYSTTDAATLYEILGDKLSLLYIEAPLKYRCERELARLHVDSTFSNRKGDPSLTIDDVMKITESKDSKKRAEGTFNYPRLTILKDNSVVLDGEGKRLVNVIQNTGTEQEFHDMLKSYMTNSILV